MDATDKFAIARKPWVLAILFATVTANLFDRQIINILAQDIKHDLVLSDAQLGLITGSALGIFKAAVSIPVTWWADRFDRAKLLAILVATWSGFTALCGVASGFGTLALARMGVGAGESGGVPVAAALVRDHFPRRATAALAVMSVGNPFGTFLAFLIGGMIAQRWGWRAAFLVAGVPGLVLAPIVWAMVKDPRSERRPAGGRSAWLRDVLSLLRKPGATALLCATFASMFLVNAANAWLPAFFIRVHGLNTGLTGVYGATAIGLGGGLGSLSGLLCESVRHRISSPESKLLIASLVLAVPFLALTVLSRTTTGALLCYWIYNFVAYAWLAPTIRLIQDSVGRDDRALAVAVCSAFGFFMALGIGVPVTGWLSDMLSLRYGPRSVGIALLVTSSVAAIVGLASHSYLLLRAKLQKGV
jgi:predicted MFS family arabinose efflux permease